MGIHPHALIATPGAHLALSFRLSFIKMPSHDFFVFAICERSLASCASRSRGRTMRTALPARNAASAWILSCGDCESMKIASMVGEVYNSEGVSALGTGYDPVAGADDDEGVGEGARSEKCVSRKARAESVLLEATAENECCIGSELGEAGEARRTASASGFSRRHCDQ